MYLQPMVIEVEKTYSVKIESQVSIYQLVHGTSFRSHALCRTDCVSHYHEIPLDRTSPYQSMQYSFKGLP